MSRLATVAITAALGIALASVPAVAAAAPATAAALPLREAVAALPVADEVRDGYQREKFRHWVDADRDGCSTRAEVLIDEAALAPEIGLKCAIAGGSWYSSYDDEYVPDARAIDIDHMVPLAEAWDSGASAWTAKRREEYANDLGEARALIAVTARSNRSKADQDPSTWLPPYAPAQCGYITDWVSVKTRWGLTVDDHEKSVLVERSASCPNVPIAVAIA
ncbi:HNH endonuclease family protein [Lentzea sp. NPDC051213]|uniref:HNH endonuclease family protein n=1 Tax=Lentzea sp. NPDC051213 TaxID=3364126 RepID=UPI0037A0FF4D